MTKLIYIFLLISATFYQLHMGGFSEPAPSHSIKEIPSSEKDELVMAPAQDKAPKLEIEIAGSPGHLTWNSQVRYTIHVSDPKDGDSRFGEIDARACLMEIEYFSAGEESKVNEIIKTKEEHKGLSLMKRSTCFGCHADKTKLAGPSFEEIAERYENNSVSVQELGSHVINGSSGIWGSQMMPSHPDLTLEEASQITDYILEQGQNKNRWIYPGLEGTFRIIEKPEGHEQGIYLLTASYTSTSNKRSKQSIVFKIK